MKNIVLLLVFAMIFNHCLAQDQLKKERVKVISEVLSQETDASFVLYDQNRDEYYRYNPEACNKRFPPMSTFKIPNSLIALETGVLKNANSEIKWDSIRNPRSEFMTVWNQDHVLATALKNSVVWYYQEVARRVGQERMQAYVSKIDYGNNETDGGIDEFWFWKLQISTNEQIEFLRKLHNYQIPFEKYNIDVVKDILVLEETDHYTISAKTGGGRFENDKAVGWFVGYVEKDQNVFYFAINVFGKDYFEIKDNRIDYVLEILTNLSII